MVSRYTEGTCENCGKRFVGLRSGQAPRRFCSTKCAYEGRSSGNEARARTLAATVRECARCGASFTPASSVQKYCSGGCKRKVDAERAMAEYMDRPLICAHCGKEYARVDGERKYCSVDCRKSANAYQGNHTNRGGVQSEEHIQKRIASARETLASRPVACAFCGEEFVRTSPSQRYCSGQCWNRSRPTRRDQAEPRTQYTHKEMWEAHASLVKRDGNACRICGREGRPESEGRGAGRLHVDHDHVTGKIRGLLCGRCNTALGLFKDDVAVLQAAIDYLKTSEEEAAL